MLDSVRIMGVSALVAVLFLAAMPAITQSTGRFVDDDGNIHEQDIEAIAAAGITLGCNPPVNDRYCPAASITRAELAAMLIRAMGETANLPMYQGLFPDVPAGGWYTGFVERSAQLGIAIGYGDGTFRPDALVSRAEIAAFLLRAIGDRLEAPIYMGVFADVPEEAWFAEYVERLYQIGISAGCGVDPLRYCPHDPVRRDESATFIAHAFGLLPIVPR